MRLVWWGIYLCFGLEVFSCSVVVLFSWWCASGGGETAVVVMFRRVVQGRWSFRRPASSFRPPSSFRFRPPLVVPVQQFSFLRRRRGSAFGCFVDLPSARRVVRRGAPSSAPPAVVSDLGGDADGGV